MSWSTNSRRSFSAPSLHGSRPVADRSTTGGVERSRDRERPAMPHDAPDGATFPQAPAVRIGARRLRAPRQSDFLADGGACACRRLVIQWALHRTQNLTNGWHGAAWCASQIGEMMMSRASMVVCSGSACTRVLALGRGWADVVGSQLCRFALLEPRAFSPRWPPRRQFDVRVCRVLARGHEFGNRHLTSLVTVCGFPKCCENALLWVGSVVEKVVSRRAAPICRRARRRAAGAVVVPVAAGTSLSVVEVCPAARRCPRSRPTNRCRRRRRVSRSRPRRDGCGARRGPYELKLEIQPKFEVLFHMSRSTRTLESSPTELQNESIVF
jgi:hypothetical protein